MDKKFIQNLREIIRIFDREIFFQNTASCCNGISLTQCHTLLEIEKNSKISISELANNLSLDKSTVSRTVEGLVNISLVDRVIPKENRRKAILNLTENGRQVCGTINYTNDTYIEKLLKNFTSSEREEFLRLFKKLTCNMAEVRQVSCGC
ncbi:MAG: MarR family transcriptional regulator [Mariniphaga sp.]|nr:MarR family transcriptional regulator [Mariniphaga sp.]